MTQEIRHLSYEAGTLARPRLYVNAIFYLLHRVSDFVHRTLRIPTHTLLLQLRRRDVHLAADWHLLLQEANLVFTTTSPRFDQAMYHIIIQNLHFQRNNATTILLSVITCSAVCSY